jgi:hypothetical protein
MKIRLLLSIIMCSSFFGINLRGQGISGESSSVYYRIGINESSALSEPKYFDLNPISKSGTSQTNQFNIKNPQVIFGLSEAKYFKIYSIDSKSNYSQITTNPSPLEYNNKLLPVSTTENLNTYALIIGNEDYSNFQTGLSKEQNVDFALNDAKVFKDLCTITLGIPEKNIIYIENAGFIKMKQSIAQLNLIAKHSSGKATLIFYYAGHGLPDELEKTPYLIPVDVSGSSLDFAISLPSVYHALTEYPAEKVVVFLDACFTGGSRNSSLISTRAVRVRPKQNAIIGNNLVVFSSSNSEQSSIPYSEKKQGLFTYYLINKFIESNGDVKFGDLDEYLRSKVPLTSILINKTEQVPTVITSPNISEKWENWSLRN